MKQRGLFNTIESSSTWIPSAPPSLDGVDEIVLDCETTGLRWWNKDLPIGIALGYKRGEEIVTQYLPWGHRGGGNLDEGTVLRWARQELRGKRIKNLNSRFDNHMLYAWGVDLEEQNCVWGDIAHYAGLLDDQRRSGFSLEAIAQDYLKEGKIKGIDVENISELHAGDAQIYAEQDVRLVVKTMDLMRPLLKAQGLDVVADLEDEVIFPVCEMERNGAPLDVEKLGLWIKKSETDLMECIWKLHRITGTRIDPMSRDDLVKLFRIRNITIKKWTSGGVTGNPLPSFTDEVLSEIDDEAVGLVRWARRIISLRSKYLVNYSNQLRNGNIIRYGLNQLKGDRGGTISGRFSSSAMTRDGEDGAEGINIQQVMRPDGNEDLFGEDYVIRELFIPEPGTHWLSSDAKQIEFRWFAHFSDSSRLIAKYLENPDTDFHNIVWDIVKHYNPDFTRKNTKDTNFAQIYGAGTFKTSQMIKVAMDRAEEFVDVYHRAFPEVKELLSKASRIARNQGFVKTILGRRFFFPDGQWLHKALSRIIQGTAADCMKKKLVELHRARKKTGFKMRFTVHDEVNGDVPDKESARMVEIILNEQTIPCRVPILWKVGTGANWAEAK